MNIQTKYKIGDEVVTINPDTMKMKKFQVSHMGISVFSDEVIVNYWGNGMRDAVREQNLFTSEQELFKHITAPAD